MKPAIQSCAVTGSVPTREHNEALPVTPPLPPSQYMAFKLPRCALPGALTLPTSIT